MFRDRGGDFNLFNLIKFGCPGGVLDSKEKSGRILFYFITFH